MLYNNDNLLVIGFHILSHGFDILVKDHTFLKSQILYLEPRKIY